MACIGPWHPGRVMHTVARAGQMGYHHRTERNKRIHKIGIGTVYNCKDNGRGVADPTCKSITPLGGFPHYGVVNEDYLMLKGTVMGTKKRPITIRRALFPPKIPSCWSHIINPRAIKFIDTASKIGHGRFQTEAEKSMVLGMLKKDKLKIEKEGKKDDE